LSSGIISGARSASRAQVDEQALQISSGLAALGVGNGQSVALLLRNDITFLPELQAAWKLNASSVAPRLELGTFRVGERRNALIESPPRTHAKA
jgi:acyl-CoA synthetase (AMP-forming)/AMP-acid ligase II